MKAMMKQIVAESRVGDQNAEPAHIEAIIGAGYPVAELFHTLPLSRLCMIVVISLNDSLLSTIRCCFDQQLIAS